MWFSQKPSFSTWTVLKCCMGQNTQHRSCLVHPTTTFTRYLHDFEAWFQFSSIMGLTPGFTLYIREGFSWGWPLVGIWQISGEISHWAGSLWLACFLRGTSFWAWASFWFSWTSAIWWLFWWWGFGQILEILIGWGGLGLIRGQCYSIWSKSFYYRCVTPYFTLQVRKRKQEGKESIIVQLFCNNQGLNLPITWIQGFWKLCTEWPTRRFFSVFTKRKEKLFTHR